MRVLTFRNTSRVYQAERLLRDAGIKAGLRPVPPGVPSRCGLCISLAADDLDNALAVSGLRDGLDTVYQKLDGQLQWTPVLGKL